MVVRRATVRRHSELAGKFERGVGMTGRLEVPIERNWAGNHTYRGAVQRPATIDEAAAIVREASSVRWSSAS